MSEANEKSEGRRRHHYVPRLILDRFADTDGLLFVHDRNQPGVVRRQSAKDTFVEKHLYSTKEKDGTRDRSLEVLFGELEGEVAPVVEKLVSSARRKQAASLSPDERQIWDFYMSIQFRRVPEVHAKVISEETFEQMLDETVAEYAAARGGLTDEEQRQLEELRGNANFRQNVTVRSLRSSTGLVQDALSRRGLTLASPERPNKSFIISSRPILRAGPSGETLEHPEIELWLPLAPDVAFSPFGLRGDDRFITLRDPGVRRLNELLASQSRLIASPSEALIRSLVRRD